MAGIVRVSWGAGPWGLRPQTPASGLDGLVLERRTGWNDLAGPNSRRTSWNDLAGPDSLLSARKSPPRI
ncbi:hypothetical protein [Streptomyces sp. NPDC048256]|uniref:hypothetical protein n=1 Tax=unclassified Streptomyces TaxID=2593676 RepID=UPI0033D6881D